MQPQRAFGSPDVNRSFRLFLRDSVNLDSDEVTRARSSRDWLLDQIADFQVDPSFPKSYAEHNIAYGSFARRTKKRPLDDIDLMVCLSAQGSTYDPSESPHRITVNGDNNLLEFCHDGTRYLNSTKVINRFVQKLALVPQYSKATRKRNGVAAVLSLQSYDWVFDIVPCFMTSIDISGRTYYLIPNGLGHWMKTDPRIDRERVTRINTAHDGNVLNVVRLTKYWNKRPTMPSMGSDALENMILDFYETASTASSYVDVEMPRVLSYIATAIHGSVFDPARIKGDLLNEMSYEDRRKISDRATQDAMKAKEARRFETDGDQAASCRKWAEIFGSEFPV